MDLRRWIVALLLLCTALHAQPVSFADLARHQQYRDVKISPNGKYLAATAVVKGQTVLALINLGDKKGGTKVIPREGNEVINFWWATSNRVVYTVGAAVGGFDAPLATGELFGVNADGGNQMLLYGQRKQGEDTGTHITQAANEGGIAEFIASIPGDANHALVAISSWGTLKEGTLPTAFRMDVRDGSTVRIVAAPPMRDARFIADHHGRIRFAIGLDTNGNVKVYQHPIDGDGWQLLSKPGDDRAYPRSFSRDDSVAYFNCGASDGGFGVCSWDPTKGTWTTVWSNPKVEPGDFVNGMADNDIIGVGFTDGRPGMSLFNSESADAKALVALMNQLPGENVRFVSGSTDGSLSIVLAEADADPGTFYLYDHNAKKLTPLLARASWINPEVMASKQPFEFAARDGLKLQGYISYPPGQESAKHLPMVVEVHGGPFGVSDDWDFDPYVQVLATRGYAVLQVNYRGSAGRGYDFERAGWKEWGGKMQDDVTDATRWAIAQNIADPQRICIYGGSYGGYAALEGAVKEPDLYKCAIGYVGVYDLTLMFTRGDIPQSTSGENFQKRTLGEDMDVLAQRSPVNQLDHLKARVMLAVGGEDPRVPSIQGSNLHMALLKRRIAHEWMDKPGEMHGFYDEGNLAELYKNMVEFVSSSIGPGVAVAGPTGVDGSTASTH
jgi:dipeptidyl aminopeptidase/acylaminoacyl peptidase